MKTLVRWRPVAGYPLYEVSTSGVLRRTDTKRVLQGTPTRDGYRRHILSCGGVKKMKPIHQIVMETFVGPRPEGMVTCHNNGDPSDNRLRNLRYGTTASNQQDMLKHGHHNMARKTHCDYGHEFTSENTYIRPNGGRTCNACRRRRRSSAV